MMTRVRMGAAAWPNVFADAPEHGSQLTRKKHRRDDPPLQLDNAGRSAEFCLAHLRAKHFGSNRGRVTKPALLESNRRPENAPSSASFAVATAPSLLREGRPPTAYQGLAEGEPIKA